MVDKATDENPPFDVIVVCKLENFSWPLDETVLCQNRLKANGVTLPPGQFQLTVRSHLRGKSFANGGANARESRGTHMPTPFLMGEGPHIDHFGNLIWPIYVDLRLPSDREPITRLVKGCRTEHAIETGQTVLISKPSRFRDQGENLIRDLGEAYASQKMITYDAVDDPDHLANARRRDQAENRAYELIGAPLRTNTTSVHRTRSNTRSFTHGMNGWIFCASIEPTTAQEWDLWRGTLQDDYDHVSFIQRPREFARTLATMVAEQLEPQGKTHPFTHSFNGEPTFRTQHSVQMLFHGPVIYVDDVYALIDASTSEQERMLLPLFAKATKYRDMREYRFAIWAEREPSGEKELLTASAAMIGSMGRESPHGEPQIMPPIESLEAEKEEVEEDGYFDDDCDDEPDEWIPSPVEDVESSSSDPLDFRRGLFELLDDPATTLRPNRIDPDAELPDDLSTLTATYSAVKALRNKVNRAQTDDDLPAERKIEAASAAFYAEQHIQSLCESYDDPVSGISISPDGYIVVEVSLQERPDMTCKMAVAPTGECAMQLRAPGRQSTVTVQNPWLRSNMGQSVRQFLDDEANRSILDDNAEALPN